MGDHGIVSMDLAKLNGIKSLSKRSNLINLYQNGVGYT